MEQITTLHNIPIAGNLSVTSNEKIIYKGICLDDFFEEVQEMRTAQKLVYDLSQSGCDDSEYYSAWENVKFFQDKVDDHLELIKDIIHYRENNGTF